MPFDEFFSSKNKHHYVRSERYEREVMPEVNRVLALPEHERCAYISALRIKRSKQPLPYIERHVLHKLDFIYKRKHDAIQKRLHWRRAAYLKKFGVAMVGGFNTAS